MSTEPFNLVLTQQAKLSLAAVKDKRHQSLLIQSIQQLRIEPEKQGKARFRRDRSSERRQKSLEEHGFICACTYRL